MAATLPFKVAVTLTGCALYFSTETNAAWMLCSIVNTRWFLVIQCHVFIVCALPFLLNVVRGTPGVVWRRLSLCHDVCDCLAHCMGAVKRYQFDALLSLGLVFGADACN